MPPVKGSNSKDYVLSLLFVKHLSERYELRKQELQQSFFDAPVETQYFASLSPEEQQLQLALVLEDELEYQVKNVYRLPQETTWEYLRENADQDDIKVNQLP